jgi:hypothetical protein
MAPASEWMSVSAMGLASGMEKASEQPQPFAWSVPEKMET